MSVLKIGNTGTNQPMTSGTLVRPFQWGTGSMALFTSCYNFASNPDGWNASLTQTLWQQPAPNPSVLSGTFTPPDLLNQNWANNMLMFATNGTVAVVGNVSGLGGHLSGGVTYDMDLGAIPVCTVFVSVANYTVINTGQCGVDPNPTITDSAGNDYSAHIVSTVTGAGTSDDPFESSYLIFSMNVPVSSDLKVHVHIGSGGPANVLVWGMTHLVDHMPVSLGNELLSFAIFGRLAQDE